MINIIKDILKIKFQKVKGNSNSVPLCQSILNSYISYDNEKVVLTIKRLLLIYVKSKRILKLNIFLKWNVQTAKIISIENKIKEISRTQRMLSRANSAVQTHSHNLSYDREDSDIIITKPNEFSIISHPKKQKSFSLKNMFENNNTQTNYHHIPSNLERRFKIKEQIVKNGFLHSNIPKKKTVSKLTKNERIKYINDLYQTNAAKEEKIKQMRLEKEKDFMANYTFKPVLQSGKTLKHQSSASTPFLLRLKDYEKSKQANLNNLKKGIESERPKPKSVSKRNGTITIPLRENYFDEKRKKVNEIKKEMETEQGITFKPKLNDQQNLRVRDTVTKRNQKFLREKEEKLLNNTYYSTNEKECTFTPQLNSNKSKSKINKTFDERLNDYQNIYEVHKEEIRIKYEQNYPFMPEISPNTSLILNNKKFIMEQMKKKNEELLTRNNTNNDNNAMTNNTNENINSNNRNNIMIQEENNIENIKSEKNEAFCSHSQEIQEISDEETNSIANYESKDLRNSDKKTNIRSSIGSKLKFSSGSFSDERAFELAKTKLSVDESLEKFQLKYNGLARKYENNNIKNIKKCEITRQKDVKPKGALINHLDYYDNLD